MFFHDDFCLLVGGGFGDNYGGDQYGGGNDGGGYDEGGYDNYGGMQNFAQDNTVNIHEVRYTKTEKIRK